MKPRSMSEWMTPAARTAGVPARIVQALTSSPPTVKNEIKPHQRIGRGDELGPGRTLDPVILQKAPGVLLGQLADLHLQAGREGDDGRVAAVHPGPERAGGPRIRGRYRPRPGSRPTMSGFWVRNRYPRRRSSSSAVRSARRRGVSASRKPRQRSRAAFSRTSRSDFLAAICLTSFSSRLSMTPRSASRSSASMWRRSRADRRTRGDGPPRDRGRRGRPRAERRQPGACPGPARRSRVRPGSPEVSPAVSLNSIAARVFFFGL